MNTSHLSYAGAVALVALILTAEASPAQYAEGQRTAGQLVTDLERSERLFQEALRLEADRTDLTKAARLYVQSAELRPYGDVQAYVALDRAGKLFFHEDRVILGRKAFAHAAVRALETGHVYEAARAFANAAEIGLRESGSRARDRVLDYHRIALRLSESPLLTEEQRQQIHERLGVSGG